MAGDPGEAEATWANFGLAETRSTLPCALRRRYTNAAV